MLLTKFSLVSLIEIFDIENYIVLKNCEKNVTFIGTRFSFVAFGQEKTYLTNYLNKSFSIEHLFISKRTRCLDRSRRKSGCTRRPSQTSRDDYGITGRSGCVTRGKTDLRRAVHAPIFTLSVSCRRGRIDSGAGEARR